MYKPILLLVFLPIFSFAQFSFGVRGGVNVDSKNNITAYIASIDNDINIYLNRGGSNFGGYLQYDFNRFFLRAEYNRTRIRNNHSIPYILVRTKQVIEDYTIRKAEIPLLTGFKASKTVNLFTGYKLFRRSKQEFRNIEIFEMRNASKNNLLFGLGLNFTHFSIAMQYEPAPSETTVPYLDNPIEGKTQYINSEGSFWVLNIAVDMSSFFRTKSI